MFEIFDEIIKEFDEQSKEVVIGLYQQANKEKVLDESSQVPF